jgi:hypothetical protein
MNGKERHREKGIKIMALTKKQLKEILSEAGVDSEKMSEAVDKIIDGHTTSIEALREERNNYKAEAEKVPDLEKEVEELQKSADSSKDDSFKVKYEAMKEEFDKFKNETTAKETARLKKDAYKKLLKELNVSEKRIDSVLKVTNLNDLKLDKEGNFEDSDKLKESIKSEWSDFIVKTEVKGAKTTTPPANGGTKTMTKEEIMAIKDGATRRQKMAENPELFGIGEE